VALQRLAGAGARRMAGSNALNEHSPVFKRPGSPVKATGHTKLIGETGVVKNADIKTSTESLSNAFCRHRTSIPFAGDYPYVSCEAYIAPNATVVGEVEIGDKSLIWSGAVVRGDEGLVDIGAMCNVLENTVITADCDRTDMSLDTDGTGGRPDGIGGTTKIGSYVTVGPNCVLRACTIEHSVVIGAGSVVCEGALIEAGATVGPGSVVPPGRRVPANEHWAGNPLTFVDSQGDHACEINDQISKDYHDRAQDFKFAVYPLPEPSYSMLHVKAAAAEAAGH